MNRGVDQHWSQCSTSTLSASETTTVGKTVTKELSAGFSVKIKGIGGSADAKKSISTTWSHDYTEQFEKSVETCSDLTKTAEDANKLLDEDRGFVWTWQFTTTYNWNSIPVTTKTDQQAYTKNLGYPPRCYPKGGTDDSYQSCVDGYDLPGALSGNATVV